MVGNRMIATWCINHIELQYYPLQIFQLSWIWMDLPFIIFASYWSLTTVDKPSNWPTLVAKHQQGTRGLRIVRIGPLFYQLRLGRSSVHTWFPGCSQLHILWMLGWLNGFVTFISPLMVVACCSYPWIVASPLLLVPPLPLVPPLWLVICLVPSPSSFCDIWDLLAPKAWSRVSSKQNHWQLLVVRNGW